jgi:hypothetical protein
MLRNTVNNFVLTSLIVDTWRVVLEISDNGSYSHTIGSPLEAKNDSKGQTF